MSVVVSCWNIGRISDDPSRADSKQSEPFMQVNYNERAGIYSLKALKFISVSKNKKVKQAATPMNFIAESPDN